MTDELIFWKFFYDEGDFRLRPGFWAAWLPEILHCCQVFQERGHHQTQLMPSSPGRNPAQPPAACSAAARPCSWTPMTGTSHNAQLYILLLIHQRMGSIMRCVIHHALGQHRGRQLHPGTPWPSGQTASQPPPLNTHSRCATHILPVIPLKTQLL